MDNIFTLFECGDLITDRLFRIRSGFLYRFPDLLQYDLNVSGKGPDVLVDIGWSINFHYCHPELHSPASPPKGLEADFLILQGIPPHQSTALLWNPC
jgi:hypothetical protein